MRNYRIYYMNSNDYEDMWVHPTMPNCVALKCVHMDESKLPTHIQYYLDDSNSDVYTVEDSDTAEYKNGFVVAYGNGFTKYFENFNNVMEQLESDFEYSKTFLIGIVSSYKAKGNDLEYSYWNNDLKELYDSISEPKPAYEEWIKQ